MKQVFLSADDFGRSHKRNLAIDKSFKKGFIKSAGLIMTGQYLQDAVNMMRVGGYVEDVHCHFNVSGNINGEDSYDKPLTERMVNDKSFCADGLFKPYKKLPNRPKEVFKWWKVYKELCAQYNKFLHVTEGKGNRRHVDFHLWYNLTWSVSIALNFFTWTHRITSVRYIGVHQEKSRRLRLYRLLLWNPFVKFYRSSNIDGYLTHPEWFEKETKFELYCHPDYMAGKEDVLMDNSISYFEHEKRSMAEQIELLKKYDLEFVSWNQV